MSNKKPHFSVVSSGDPGEIRTPDLLIRSQTLYPAELLSHNLPLEYNTTICCSLQVEF